MPHITPRSATVTLYQGDDMDRLAELRRAVAVAERNAEATKDSARLGDDDQSVLDAKRAFDAFVDEAAARAVTIELRSIGRRRFRDLVAEHPPRMVDKPKVDLPQPGETVAVPSPPEQVEHADDAGYGVNTETFGRALLAYRDDPVVTIAQPEFNTRAEVESFIDDELAEGDFDQLWIAAFMLNRSPSRDPKAAGFGTSQSSETTSI